MNDSGMPPVSVIIPTYHDWSSLSHCLQAVAKQSYPCQRFEILVVNNAPEDAPPSDLYLPSNARLLTESKPGSYAARNAAIRQATGEVLVFLDADCAPVPGWLEAALACMETRGADLVAGHIALTYRGVRLTPAECFEKAFAFRQTQNVAQGVAVTANLLVRRELFNAVGLFDDSLLSGGDFEWTRRATSAGFTLVYCRYTAVHHPARHSIASLASKSRRVSAGSMALHRERRLGQGAHRVLGNLLGDLRELFRRSDMTWRERWWALYVLVYLKFVKLHQRLTMASRSHETKKLPR